MTGVQTCALPISGLLALIAFLFSIRTEIEATLLRAKGTTYQEYDSTHYSNIYMMQVINKTRDALPVELTLEKPEGEIKFIGDPLVVEKGAVGELQFLVIIKKSDLHASSTKLEFKVTCNGKKMDEIEATFAAPNALDRK